MRDELIKLIDDFIHNVNVEEWYSEELDEKLADAILDSGRIIVLPCKVGSTLYRIDTRSKQCSYKNEHYDEYYCRDCRIRLNGDCDARKEPYIFTIRNADAQAILGNQHLIGTRVFLAREEVEKALAEWSSK